MAVTAITADFEIVRAERRMRMAIVFISDSICDAGNLCRRFCVDRVWHSRSWMNLLSNVLSKCQYRNKSRRRPCSPLKINIFDLALPMQLLSSSYIKFVIIG